MFKANIKYVDDNGNPISQEEFKTKYAKFVAAYEKEYEQKVERIVEEINNECETNRDKLWALFNYLIADKMKYDLVEKVSQGKRSTHPGYQFTPYGKVWRIKQGTKYPAILFNSGVCGSYSATFEDICQKLKIPCKTVYGFAGMDHAWNVVLEDGQLKHIDIAYAIMNRDQKDKADYFMKSFAELQEKCGNRTMNQTTTELINELAPQLKVKSRSDKNKPGIQKPTESTEELQLQFKVKKRSDSNNHDFKVINKPGKIITNNMRRK